MPKHSGQKWIHNKAYLCEVSEQEGQRKEPLSLQREKNGLYAKNPTEIRKILNSSTAILEARSQ